MSRLGHSPSWVASAAFSATAVLISKVVDGGTLPCRAVHKGDGAQGSWDMLPDVSRVSCGHDPSWLTVLWWSTAWVSGSP